MKPEDCVGKREINASKIAELTGFSKMHVQRMLRGDYPMSDKFLKALEHVKIEDVLRGKIKKNL